MHFGDLPPPQPPKDYLPKISAVHRIRSGVPISGVVREEANRPNLSELAKHKNFSLLSLSKDYSLFTVGVLCCSNRYERDLIQEFATKYPDVTEAMPYVLDYTDRFFYGFPPATETKTGVDYNRRLYLIHKDRWILLRDMVASCAFVDIKTDYYARINYYDLQLADPFALRRMRIVNELPTVSCTVFGYSSTQHFSYVQPRQYPALPTYTQEPPRPDIIFERDARFAKIKKI